MAGLIARLFGGRDRPPDPDPLPGQGGYALPPGPYGASGFPGSTSATRYFSGASPRSVKLRTDKLGGFDQGLDGPQARQASFRGDDPTAPRQTPDVITPQPVITARMQQNSPAEFYGGPMLDTAPGLNDTAGGNPLSPAQDCGGHSVRDTETPATRRQPVIGAGTPGAQNVRNQVAQRYKNPPGQVHQYMSAPRADQGDGPTEAAASPVSVPNRFVFPGGGNQTWSVQRQMPYGGRGDGARGADLNGQRYYAAGAPAFADAGQGQYGISRLRGPNHRPTQFVEPAPWSANYYDTTAEVQAGTSPQAPGMTYVSPSAGRASNSTGRTG